MSGVVSTSMDNAIKISSIKSSLAKEIINEQLKYYILDYNNDKYITKMALEEVYSLDLKGKNLTSEDLEGLSIFSNVSIIDLSDNNITNVDELSKLIRLTSLNLNNNNVKDVSVLKDLVNLNVIKLSGNDGVTGYQYLEYLNELDLSNTNLVVLEDITNNDYLYNLNLSNNTQLDFESLKLPDGIAELSLDNTNFSNVDLSNLNELYSLSLKNNNLKNLDALQGINSLGELDVSYNNIDDFSFLNEIFKQNDDDSEDDEDEYDYYDYYNIRLVAQFNNISDISIFNGVNVEELDLSNNNISDLSNFDNENVTIIKLSYNKVEKGIETLKNVSEIYLDHCGLNNLNGFAKLDEVNYLVLDGNNINDFSELKSLDNLVSLSLNDNNITDLSGISKLENIENLSLGDNDIVDITPLNNMPLLSSLSLYGNKNISGQFSENINYLNLENCNLDNNVDLSKLNQLSYINLSNSQFHGIDKIIENTDGEWFYIDVKGLVITEEEFLNIEQLALNEKNFYISGANFELNLELDSDNNINLQDKYYIRKLFMQQLNNSLAIENGAIDNKVEFIHVINPDEGKVSFKSSFVTYNFGSANVTILY